MVQYWWVNQTHNHEFERSKSSGYIVAGQIRKENPDSTVPGRKNVKRMCEDDLIICYVGRLGIDHVARVVKRSNERPAPWPGSDHKNETAYVANVKYFTIKPTIKKEEYMDKMLNYGYYKYSPFSSVGTINQGYAFELDDVRFNFLTGLRNLSQSDFMI